jgi:GxxExxY protein
LLESIYEEAVCHEFNLRGIRFRRQVEIDVIYKGKIIKGQRIDVLVEEEVIIEIKSLSKLPRSLWRKSFHILGATGLKRGLLINFGAKMLREGIKRISL